jgi:hypothetical protein
MTDTELDETMRAQEEHERQVKKGGAGVLMR